ncbi:MAG: methyltransferase domain-containing protein [Planctomycetota bacterium]
MSETNIAIAETTGDLFEWQSGVATFRGLPVQQRCLRLAGRDFTIWSLQDAAQLLDHEEYAKPFIDADIAPYGLELWSVAVLLAEHVLQDEPGRGRSALDLGCGLGLTAIAATVHGWKVLAADHEPTSLRFASYNADYNGVSVSEFTPFDWNHPPADLRVDRVFAADVLYQRVDHVPILRCLAVALARDGMAWIADPNRPVADGFSELAAEHGWSVEIRSGVAPNFFSGPPIQGRIFQLRRKT